MCLGVSSNQATHSTLSHRGRSCGLNVWVGGSLAHTCGFSLGVGSLTKQTNDMALFNLLGKVVSLETSRMSLNVKMKLERSRSLKGGRCRL